MARPDKVMGRFRGVVDTDLTGLFGTGDGAGLEDLILVKSDSSGLLIVATQGTAEGVIWTPEGKADPTVTDFFVAQAGSVMTVFTLAEFSDTEGDTTNFAVGVELWSTAAGDVVTSVTATPSQKVARTYANEKGGVRTVFSITHSSI